MLLVHNRFAAAFLVLVAFTMVSGPQEAYADQYFNSAEPGCNTSNPDPNYLMCDDFEDGRWYETCNDPNLSVNDGWLGCNGSRTTDAAVCGGNGAVGTNCSTKSVLANGSDGGLFNSALGLHGFYPNNATYNEIYVRFYIRLSPGYVANNNQKFFSLIRSAYQGGIDYGGIGRNLREMHVCPMWTCNYLNEGYLFQNQGNNISFQDNHWYYVEFHIKLNTYNQRNGIFEMWADDCGTNGLGCTGLPTLRHRRTNVGWQGGGSYSGEGIGSLWLDIWGNPSDGGTINVDQIISSRSFIGPMGATAGDKTPPAAPHNLRLQ